MPISLQNTWYALMMAVILVSLYASSCGLQLNPVMRRVDVRYPNNPNRGLCSLMALLGGVLASTTIYNAACKYNHHSCDAGCPCR